MKKKVKINYASGDFTQDPNTDIKKLKFYSVVVEGKSTKRYHNCISLILQLSKCARVLLDFILEEMDDNNRVTNSQLFKSKFNGLITKFGYRKYSDNSINKAFGELVKFELIKSLKERSLYKVNPIFFYNGTEKSREKEIRFELEKPNMKIISSIRKKYYENND